MRLRLLRPPPLSSDFAQLMDLDSSPLFLPSIPCLSRAGLSFPQETRVAGAEVLEGKAKLLKYGWASFWAEAILNRVAGKF